jgi:hypothetical protein
MILFFFKGIFFFKFFFAIGIWELGFGVWGWGFGPNPHYYINFFQTNNIFLN